MATARARSGVEVWLRLVFPAAVPFLVGVLSVHVLPVPVVSLAATGTEFLTGDAADVVHTGGLLTYLSLVLFHLTVCAAAGLYYLWQMQSLPDRLRRRSMWLAAASLPLFMLVLGVAYVLLPTSAALSFSNVRQLLNLANQHVDETLLLMLTFVPIFGGLFAVACAAAKASSVEAELAEPMESKWRDAFAKRVQVLQRGFYVLSAVLVTSTVTVSLFFHLPVELAVDDGVKQAINAYAGGLTVFWGTIFTLTLLATFAPSALALVRIAQRHEGMVKSRAEFRGWLRDQIYISAPKQLRTVAALLAPLIVGPLGNLLEKAAGG